MGSGLVKQDVHNLFAGGEGEVGETVPDTTRKQSLGRSEEIQDPLRPQTAHYQDEGQN